MDIQLPWLLILLVATATTYVTADSEEEGFGAVGAPLRLTGYCDCDCLEDKCPLDQVTGEVCAANGVTFASECELRRDNCNRRENQQLTFDAGACPEDFCPSNCKGERVKKTCAIYTNSKGNPRSKTYRNRCKLLVAQCKYWKQVATQQLVGMSFTEAYFVNGVCRPTDVAPPAAQVVAGGGAAGDAESNEQEDVPAGQEEPTEAPEVEETEAPEVEETEAPEVESAESAESVEEPEATEAPEVEETEAPEVEETEAPEPPEPQGEPEDPEAPEPQDAPDVPDVEDQPEAPEVGEAGQTTPSFAPAPLIFFPLNQAAGGGSSPESAEEAEEPEGSDAPDATDAPEPQEEPEVEEPEAPDAPEAPEPQGEPEEPEDQEEPEDPEEAEDPVVPPQAPVDPTGPAPLPSVTGGSGTGTATPLTTLPRGDTNTVADTGTACSANCDKGIAIVCGSDGLRYVSPCMLQFTGCLLNDATLTVAYQGECQLGP